MEELAIAKFIEQRGVTKCPPGHAWGASKSWLNEIGMRGGHDIFVDMFHGRQSGVLHIIDGDRNG